MTELYQSLSHSKWDCKYHVVPCCIRAQTAAKSHLRSDTPTSGTDFPWAGAAKGMPDSRRASDAGPCAHVHRHSPQAHTPAKGSAELILDELALIRTKEVARIRHVPVRLDRCDAPLFDDGGKSRATR